jgi:hypothetical protein
MKYLIVFFVLFYFSLPAMAQGTVMDGNDLEFSCKYLRLLHNGANQSLEDFGKAMFCAGYIRGALDALFVDNTLGVKRGNKDGELKYPCFPPNVTNDQKIKVVIKYLADNPAELHSLANMLILRSMNAAFPCH